MEACGVSMNVRPEVEISEAAPVAMCSLHVADRRFGIDTKQIVEVLGSKPLRSVPLAPPFVAGIFAYRGEVLPAVSLRALLGLRPLDAPGCLLVLDAYGAAESERFGLEVDGVGGVVLFDSSSFARSPTTLDELGKALFSGAYCGSDGLLVQIDSERLTPGRLAETGLFDRRRMGTYKREGGEDANADCG